MCELCAQATALAREPAASAHKVTCRLSLSPAFRGLHRVVR